MIVLIYFLVVCLEVSTLNEVDQIMRAAKAMFLLLIRLQIASFANTKHCYLSLKGFFTDPLHR